MRIAFELPLLLLGACDVDRDAQNDTTTLQVDEDAARNTAATVADEAGDIAGHIANDVSQTADRVQNEVCDVDVDVDVSRNKPADAN